MVNAEWLMVGRWVVGGGLKQMDCMDMMDQMDFMDGWIVRGAGWVRVVAPNSGRRAMGWRGPGAARATVHLPWAMSWWPVGPRGGGAARRGRGQSLLTSSPTR